MARDTACVVVSPRALLYHPAAVYCSVFELCGGLINKGGGKSIEQHAVEEVRHTGNAPAPPRTRTSASTRLETGVRVASHV
ncbi:hypothetical protein EON66_01015 [archaeon]|nr:MAG: hypothetical protein EON66_01015 [archaeon]